jgi:hypothetical protein
LPDRICFLSQEINLSLVFVAYLVFFLGQSVLLSLFLEQLTWQMIHEITAIFLNGSSHFLPNNDGRFWEMESLILCLTHVISDPDFETKTSALGVSLQYVR